MESDFKPRSHRLREFSNWGLAHWCIAAGVLSFFILALLPEARLADVSVPFGGESVRVARSLAARGAFADPFPTLNTGPTAHVAPVYPFLYSLFLRAFGTGYAALLILWVFNLACISAQMALLPLLSWRMRLGVLPGLVAAALGSVSLFAPVDTHWESFFTGALLILFFAGLEPAFADRHSWRVTAGLGILAGILILTNPVTLLLVVAWPLCWALAQPPAERARSLGRCAVVAGIALGIVAPWIARNYAQFGGFIFVRDNLGTELYTSNNPCAAPTLEENLQSGCHAKTHPNPSREVTRELAVAGEYAYNQQKLRQALVWIDSNRREFLILTARRFRQFWLPDLGHVWERAAVGLLTLSSLAGFFVMRRKNPLAGRLILVAWILYPLIHYVVQFDPRYRYPIFWTSLLPAGCALAELALRLPIFQIFGTYPRAASREEQAFSK